MRPMARSSAWAAAAVLAACGVARGQVVDPTDGGGADDGGPVVVGAKRGRYKWFELAKTGAGLRFTTRRTEDKRYLAGQATTDRETVFREELLLNGEAYLGHRNLVDVTGDASLGLEDTLLHNESESLDRHDRSLVDTYNVNALILGESSMPGNVYARRDRTDLNRDFAGTITSVLSEYGANTSIRSLTMPTFLHVFHREQNETDSAGTADYHLRQDTATIHSEAKAGAGQRLEFDAAVDHVTDTQGGLYSDEYDRYDTTLTHSIDFGKDNRDNLRSSLRAYGQSGQFDQHVLRLDEQLRLYHSDRLETRYNLLLENLSRGSSDQRTVRGNANLTHRLFDSLVTNLNAGGSLLDTDGFRSTEAYTSARLDYTKKVPMGTLLAGLSAGLNHQDNGERGSVVSVLGQSATFTGVFPVTLARRNILPGSVRVRDPLTPRVYLEGVDYTLSAFPDRVELRNIIGGALPDGSGTLVDYDIGPEPANTIDTVSSGASVRYNIEEGWLRGLALYAYYRRTDESIDAVDPTQFVLEDLRETRYGAEYQVGHWTLLAEATNHDSSTNPYDSTRAEARYAQRVGPDSVVTALASRDEINYSDPGDTLILYRLLGNMQLRVSREVDVNLRIQYRHETDTARSMINGVEESIDLRWRRRQTQVSAAVRNANLQSGDSKTETLYLFLELRRDF